MRVMLAVCLSMLACVGTALGERLPVLGQVVDSTAKPVEGAEVAVYEQYTVGWQDYDARMAAPIVRTDSEGRFTLEAEITSQYDTFIVARKEGLALAWDGLSYSRNHKGKGRFLLVLEPPNDLVGHLVDADGRAVANASVQVMPVTSYLDRLRQRRILAPKQWFTASTDEQGCFRVGGFAADVSVSFRVQVPGRTGNFVLRPGEQNACGYEVWRNDIRIQLPAVGTVRGRVINDRGRPVAGVDLMMTPSYANRTSPNSYFPQTVRSDRNGLFVFDDIPEGANQIDLVVPEEGTELWVGGPVEVSVQAGQVADETIIRVDRGSMLEMTVLDETTGSPIPGAAVTVNSLGWRRGKPATANARGVARARVPAGEFSVYVTADGFSSYQSTEQIAAGRTLRFTARLPKEPCMDGHVLAADGKAAEGVVVSVHPFGDHAYTDRSGYFEAVPDERRIANGGFVVARDPSGGSAAVLPFKGPGENLELQMAPAWTLTGKVVDSEGAGIPAARVSLCLSTQNCLSDLGVEVLADSQGRYEMSPIPPLAEGFTYRLSFAAAGYGPREYVRIYPAGPGGDVIDVGPTELLLADQSVSGVVVDADGAPVPHAPIFVNGLPGVSQPSKSTATNEAGEFAFRRLCAGPIRIQASFTSSPGGAGFVRAELPAENLKIILGEERTHEPALSLAGKPLPAWNALGLQSLDTAGKRVLICFFDYQQRPSRNAVLQLARQASSLEQRGLAVLTVQAAQADRDAAADWASENCPSFALGSITGEIEPVRMAWGVKALPWLILTNKEHVVTAEGFAVGELTDQLAK